MEEDWFVYIVNLEMLDSVVDCVYFSYFGSEIIFYIGEAGRICFKAVQLTCYTAGNIKDGKCSGNLWEAVHI